MISSDGLELIKYFEGVRPTAYKDSGGILTIGYGHTKNVKEGDIITEDDAEKLLKIDLLNAEARVEKKVNWNQMPHFDQNKWDALISQAFNLRSFEMLADHLKESETIYLSKTLLYCKDVKGHTLWGLKKRRIAEVLLYLGESWENIRKVIG